MGGLDVSFSFSPAHICLKNSVSVGYTSQGTGQVAPKPVLATEHKYPFASRSHLKSGLTVILVNIMKQHV